MGGVVKGIGKLVSRPIRGLGRLARGKIGKAFGDIAPSAALGLGIPGLLGAGPLGGILGGVGGKVGGLFGKLGGMGGIGRALGGEGGPGLGRLLLGGGLGLASLLGARQQRKGQERFAQGQLDIQRRGLGQAEDLLRERAPLRQAAFGLLGRALSEQPSGIFQTSRERGLEVGDITSRPKPRKDTTSPQRFIPSQFPGLSSAQLQTTRALRRAGRGR